MTTLNTLNHEAPSATLDTVLDTPPSFVEVNFDDRVRKYITRRVKDAATVRASVLQDREEALSLVYDYPFVVYVPFTAPTEAKNAHYNFDAPTLMYALFLPRIFGLQDIEDFAATSLGHSYYGTGKISCKLDDPIVKGLDGGYFRGHYPITKRANHKIPQPDWIKLRQTIANRTSPSLRTRSELDKTLILEIRDQAALKIQEICRSAEPKPL